MSDASVVRDRSWHASRILRAMTFAMAFAHVFPARRHLGRFFSDPSINEGWKGFGALVAVGLYLVPAGVHARWLRSLWKSRRGVFRGGGLVLAAVHAVPATDHLPRFFASPGWSDGWRGVGSSLAVLWFLSPLAWQARALGCVARGLRASAVRASRPEVLTAQPTRTASRARRRGVDVISPSHGDRPADYPRPRPAAQADSGGIRQPAA